VVFANADRIMVMSRGRLVADGMPAEVRANPMVQEIYLGAGQMGHGTVFAAGHDA
jgi:branched-chain amino acid transport system ATP-binding protein